MRGAAPGPSRTGFGGGAVGSGCGGSVFSGIDHSPGAAVGGGATIGSLFVGGGVDDGGSAAGATAGALGSFELAGLLGVAGFAVAPGLLVVDGLLAGVVGSDGGASLPGNGGSLGGPTTATATSHVCPHANHPRR